MSGLCCNGQFSSELYYSQGKELQRSNGKALLSSFPLQVFRMQQDRTGLRGMGGPLLPRSCRYTSLLENESPNKIMY